MTEETHRTWDIIFKWFGLAAVLASALWTVYKYRQDREVDLDHQKQGAEALESTRKNELNSYIFQDQAKLYFDAARTAATLAMSKDPKRLRDAGERFNELFYGKLVVVEDRRVELAMIAYRDCWRIGGKDCWRIKENQYGKPIDPAKLFNYGPPVPDNFSLELAACVRSALQEDRGIQCGHIKEAKTTCPYE